ncbi:MAG: fumarylacetoacetate hydrolase family protein [Gammaproteobacteria bacterium]
MKLVSCLHDDRTLLGVMVNEQIVVPALMPQAPATFDDMLALIDAGPEAMRQLGGLVAGAPAQATLPLNSTPLAAPIPRPRQNVICLGWNYRDHVEEAADLAKQKLPEHPVVFTKAVSSVTGPYDDIPFDGDVSAQIDWEVELGVVIGKPGRGIAKADALKHVFGYTVINDVSARDLQFRHQQFYVGKSLDGACPMGPCIVTADEISDPQALDLRCQVNGKPKQDSNTRHQIFDVATTISILSQGMTLQAGDVIATGTPSGVGFTREPPEFLAPGDVVECEVESIGHLRNEVVQIRPGY